MYPVQERLVDGLRAEGDASAFVDIGGGTGQVLQDFRAGVPQYTGRLVLQELAGVVAVAEGAGVGAGGSGIELQVHDFFTPQPIRGARAYFMRSVLHDWPDEQCRTILEHLRDAMEPDYSRILISDCVSAWRSPFIPPGGSEDGLSRGSSHRTALLTFCRRCSPMSKPLGSTCPSTSR